MTVTKRTAADGTQTTDESFVNIDPNHRETFERDFAMRRGGGLGVSPSLRRPLPIAQPEGEDTVATPRPRTGWLGWLWGRKE